MPPPPTQAGRFKPRKPPTTKKKPPSAVAGQVSKPSEVGSSSGSGGEGRGRGGNGGRGDGPRSDATRGGGRGRGRGGGGRDGRGGRGGRGRGRIPLPRGQVFFTGDATHAEGADGKKRGAAAAVAAAAARGRHGVGDAGMEGNETSIAPGQAGGVIMPGMGGRAAGSGGISSVGGSYSHKAAQSLAAAAASRAGEGEELVVGEIDGGGVGSRAAGDAASKISSSSTRRDGLPSLFDNDNDEDGQTNVPTSAYTYDSDSSDDDAPSKGGAAGGGAVQQPQQRIGRHDSRYGALPPSQLPFPLPNLPRGVGPDGGESQNFIYACQISDPSLRRGVAVPYVASSSGPTIKAEEKKGEDDNVNENGPTLDAGEDPPIRSPFIDWDRASLEDRRREQNSWMILKLPTRLPQLDPRSTLSGMTIKSERQQSGGMDDDDDVNDDMDIDGSNGGSAPGGTSMAGAGAAAAAATSTGFDDTLKDAAPGRYGKILVYKSGRTVLVVGGGDNGEPEVRMEVTEGLQCGFLQQAVAIDPEEGTFIPLGEVKKALVITPDVESAFPSS